MYKDEPSKQLTYFKEGKERQAVGVAEIEKWEKEIQEGLRALTMGYCHRSRWYSYTNYGNDRSIPPSSSFCSPFLFLSLALPLSLPLPLSIYAYRRGTLVRPLLPLCLRAQLAPSSLHMPDETYLWYFDPMRNAIHGCDAYTHRNSSILSEHRSFSFRVLLEYLICKHSESSISEIK